MTAKEVFFVKRGDSIVEERLPLDGVTTLIKIYDFDAAELTTIQRSLMTNGAGGADASTQTFCKSFNDVAERKLKKCREKLIELGGSPPPLDGDAPKNKKTQSLKLD